MAASTTRQFAKQANSRGSGGRDQRPQFPSPGPPTPFPLLCCRERAGKKWQPHIVNRGVSGIGWVNCCWKKLRAARFAGTTASRRWRPLAHALAVECRRRWSNRVGVCPALAWAWHTALSTLHWTRHIGRPSPARGLLAGGGNAPFVGAAGRGIELFGDAAGEIR